MASFDILLVDDSYPTVRALAYLLTRSGYRSRIAVDGVEALKKMRERKPDLVVLDIRMPRMDGFEVCRKIRSDQALKDLYVIILSGAAQDGEIARALEAGANECMSKPLDPPKILERIRAVLSPVES